MVVGHRQMDRELASDPYYPEMPRMVSNLNAVMCECRYGGDRCMWPAEQVGGSYRLDYNDLAVCEWCAIGLCHEEPHGFHG